MFKQARLRGRGRSIGRPNYIQHKRATIEPGRRWTVQLDQNQSRAFTEIRTRIDHGLKEDFVVVAREIFKHRPARRLDCCDIVRIENGPLGRTLDVIQDVSHARAIEKSGKSNVWQKVPD